MISASTIQLLRFHFSFFLMPVYFFGISQVGNISVPKAIAIFLILHLLVYPASNGYNSYMDRDSGPVGGIKDPLQPTRQLYFITIWMDILAVALSLFIGYQIAVAILLYILASRAYSARSIRIKKYPIGGFLLVMFFQGAICFYIAFMAANSDPDLMPPLLAMTGSSFLIGSLYPLTQIYQHEADRKDGVITLSYKLGYKGTFMFTALMFAVSMTLLFLYFNSIGLIRHFYVIAGVMFPVVLFFLYWATKVWKNTANADFKHTMIMNILTSLCMNIAFIILLIISR